MLIRGLVILSATGFAGTVIFACLYGSVYPRLKMAARRMARQRDIILKLSVEVKVLRAAALRSDERIRAAEAEVLRLGKIRERTEAGLKLKNAKVEALEARLKARS